MKPNIKNTLLWIAGIALLVAGIVFSVLTLNTYTPSPLPFVCIGIGSGILGAIIGKTLQHRKLKNNADYEAYVEIEQHDERNIAVSNRARAKAFTLSIYFYAALMLALLLLQVNYVAILLLVGVYLATILSYVFFFNKYNKEM